MLVGRNPRWVLVIGQQIGKPDPGNGRGIGHLMVRAEPQKHVLHRRQLHQRRHDQILGPAACIAEKRGPMALANDVHPLPPVGSRIEVTRHVYAGNRDTAALDLIHRIIDEAGLTGTLQVLDMLVMHILHHEEPGIGIADRGAEAALAWAGTARRDAERVDQSSQLGDVWLTEEPWPPPACHRRAPSVDAT